MGQTERLPESMHIEVKKVYATMSRRIRGNPGYELHLTDRGGLQLTSLVPQLDSNTFLPVVEKRKAKIGLNEIVERTGLSRQYILFLIQNRQLINPVREPKRRSSKRATYRFEDEHLQQLLKFIELRNAGHSFNEILGMVEGPFQAPIAEQLGSLIPQWIQSGEREVWESLINVIAEYPVLKPTEKVAFTMEQLGYTVNDIALELGFLPHKVEKIAERAYTKIGRGVFSLLKQSAKPSTSQE